MMGPGKQHLYFYTTFILTLWIKRVDVTLWYFFLLLLDFKENYELENEIEVVDFYQLICFLLQIPAQDHDGSWDRIEDILTISGSPSFLAFTITPLFTLCISLIVMQIY
jgi:hypothetical protein